MSACATCGREKGEFGQRLECTICRRYKLPVGRSAPIGYDGCDHECPGYREEPAPSSLWPGESRRAFGYGLPADDAERCYTADDPLDCCKHALSRVQARNAVLERERDEARDLLHSVEGHDNCDILHLGGSAGCAVKTDLTASEYAIGITQDLLVKAERERDEARRWRAAWKRAAGLAYAIERERGAVKDSIFRRYRAAEQQLAAAQRELTELRGSLESAHANATSRGRAAHQAQQALALLRADHAANQEILTALCTLTGAADFSGIAPAIVAVTAERDETRAASAEYVAKTDPLLDRLETMHDALAAERERAGRLEAALRRARTLVERESQEAGYGFGGFLENPHDFTPDQDCCTPEEVANHKSACEAWDRGERPTGQPRRGCEVDGGVIVCHSPWGIGGYTYRDPEMVALLAAIDAALASTPAQPQPRLEPDANGRATFESAPGKHLPENGR